MFNSKPVQILFFVDGMTPTNEDIIAASGMNAHVMFRNARAVPAEGCLEVCDGVAGKVPPRYAAKYPTAEAAIEARAKKIAELSAKTGDSPAPVTPAAPTAGDAKANAGDAADKAADAPDASNKAASDAGAGESATGSAAPQGSAGSAWKSAK